MRPFLVRFMESQMFATLIDNKIMTSFDEKLNSENSNRAESSMELNNLQLFDCRIKVLK